jgi:hypothetical protein
MSMRLIVSFSYKVLIIEVLFVEDKVIRDMHQTIEY